MRAVLDGLYRVSGILAGVFLIAIAALVTAQIVFRQVGIQIPSADDFAGFSMAASAFLGLAPTLRAGGHIRVSLFLGFLPDRGKQAMEYLCLIAGIGLTGYLTWFSLDLMLESLEFGDKSQGLVPIPLWIPQVGMVLGAAILTIAFADDLLRLLTDGRPSYEVSEVAALEADKLGNSLSTATNATTKAGR